MPETAKALSEAVERAHNVGIRVISYDRMVNDADTDMYISFDNRKVGEVMAQSMMEAIPNGGKFLMSRDLLQITMWTW